MYDQHTHEVSFAPYTPKEIKTLRVIADDSIVYSHKLEDRSAINRLYEKRNGCDDVLIVKAGLVTDCSFSNIVFRKGGTWITPSSALLPGTMRQKLIDDKRIQVADIRASDISSFDSFRIINAMLEFGSPEIEVSAIVF